MKIETARTKQARSRHYWPVRGRFRHSTLQFDSSSLKSAAVQYFPFRRRVVPSPLFALGGAWSYSEGVSHSFGKPQGLMTTPRSPLPRIDPTPDPDTPFPVAPRGTSPPPPPPSRAGTRPSTHGSPPARARSVPAASSPSVPLHVPLNYSACDCPRRYTRPCAAPFVRTPTATLPWRPEPRFS